MIAVAVPQELTSMKGSINYYYNNESSMGGHEVLGWQIVVKEGHPQYCSRSINMFDYEHGTSIVHGTTLHCVLFVSLMYFGEYASLLIPYLFFECTYDIRATSKNVLFPGHNHRLSTSTDDLTL